MDINIRCEEAIRDGKLYDFISNEGHNFSKGDLITLIKELAYGIYKKAENKNEIYEFVADNLEEER